MESMYDKIMNFMKQYFPAYSDYGQTEDTHRVMDKFYAPDIIFDDGFVSSRDQWYKLCLSHPGVQDKITLEHLFIDEKQRQAGALITTQAIDRKTGDVLVELKMNSLYTLKTDRNGDMQIARIQVFTESDAQKVARLFQIYATGSKNPINTGES